MYCSTTPHPPHPPGGSGPEGGYTVYKYNFGHAEKEEPSHAHLHILLVRRSEALRSTAYSGKIAALLTCCLCS